MTIPTSKLEALKQSRTPSPLWMFLLLYSKAKRECYINYMEGAKLLYLWLTSDGAIPLDYNESENPEINNPKFTVPSLLSGYSSEEVAKIISDYNITFDMSELAKARRAIYFNMRNKVIYELY